MVGDSNSGRPAQEIIEAGKDTRFGSERGADPTEAVNTRNEDHGHPNSIRSSIRRIACLTQAELKELANDPRLTMAQTVAVRKFMAACGKFPNIKAMKELEDSVDGKLVEKKIEVTTDSYADLLKQATDADRTRS